MGKLKKKVLLVVALIIFGGCAFLDNSGKHKPIYLTDPKYAHFREGSYNDLAPWPDCWEFNSRVEKIMEIYGP
jgi:hypothetical protein